MSLPAENLNTKFAYWIIEECVRNGLDFFCISPGSRSTPLTVAAARHPKTKTTICYDERGAAFMALGYAKATQKPAVLICTSGTAVANYLPAVVEASNDDVPMLILTADRPPELQNTGANQTINQQHIFGKFIRWEKNFKPPSFSTHPTDILPKVFVAIQVAQIKRGPAHLNFMFREPLEPAIDETTLVGPFPTKFLERYRLSKHKKDFGRTERSKISKILSRAQNGVLVCGRLHSVEDIETVKKIAASIPWPLFADISSNLRTGNELQSNIAYFDQILLSEIEPPDVILHFGGRVTSKRFLQFVEANRDVTYIHVNNTPQKIDPAHAVKIKVETEFSEFGREIQNWQFSKSENLPVLAQMNSQVANLIESKLTTNEISEPGIIRTISQIIPENNGLFLSNSMPVRDMDMYADPNGPFVKIGANRGASGIDGIFASSVGFANGLQKPATCIIGDLASLHDLNSLLHVKHSAFPITIILLNNHGGGIFHFLPISKFESVFPYFETPHELKFEYAAKMFGISYFNPKTLNEFRDIYKESTAIGPSTIIEVNTDKALNFEFHKELQTEIKKLLAQRD